MTGPRVTAIIQARMDGQRLPGKVLQRIGPRTMLEHVYERVRTVCSSTVIAIPTGARNMPLVEFCLAHELAVWVYDGPEDDVLGRYAGAAAYADSPWIVRVTADCPVIDAGVLATYLHLLQQLPETMHDGMTPHYWSPAWPKRIVPHGLDLDIISRSMMHLAHTHADDASDREHVSPWMRRYMQDMAGGGASLQPDDLGWALALDWRLVVDTPEDLRWFQHLATVLDFTPPHPTFPELYDFLRREPAKIWKGSAVS